MITRDVTDGIRQIQIFKGEMPDVWWRLEILDVGNPSEPTPVAYWPGPSSTDYHTDPIDQAWIQILEWLQNNDISPQAIDRVEEWISWMKGGTN